MSAGYRRRVDRHLWWFIALCTRMCVGICKYGSRPSFRREWLVFLTIGTRPSSTLEPALLPYTTLSRAPPKVWTFSTPSPLGSNCLAFIITGACIPCRTTFILCATRLPDFSDLGSLLTIAGHPSRHDSILYAFRAHGPHVAPVGLLPDLWDPFTQVASFSLA